MKEITKKILQVERPLVTIGILTYKRPHLLPRALEAVARQTYQPIEVIVCDDATPGDENEKVVAAFKDKIPELKYLKHATNLGDIKSYYHLLEEAQGTFFMWLADDDEISPGFVEASVEALEEHPDVPFSNAYCQIL
ncbi:MAG: glycosyltransferase family 2 protein, partial [Holosporales bacterium]|nr:glycosyltransferase family 2 protein [Holosporales bacterium]